MRSLVTVVVAVLVSTPGTILAQEARFRPAGDMPSSQGAGVLQTAVLYPDMRFPIQHGPAYANSQVYSSGGQFGPPGGQCAAGNYSYPWRDNFCEKRGHANPLCSTGRGHQGQDIRPPTCVANMHWTVAAEDGVIAQKGTFSVTLQGKSGTIYRYLHLRMDNLAVRQLDTVTKGQRIGQVSDTFKLGVPTTRHLHFEIIDAFRVGDKTISTFVPPYSSLVAAYKKLPPEEQ
jgi:murein DD-endopeptidase MepM/ murein hydrolase activator NlpD